QRRQVGHRSNRGARTLDRRGAVDSHRSGYGFEFVHRGARQALEKLACVRTETLDEAPLTFRVQRLQSQAALAGPRNTGEYRYLTRMQPERHALEVVGARAFEF